MYTINERSKGNTKSSSINRKQALEITLDKNNQITYKKVISFANITWDIKILEALKYINNLAA